MNSSNCFEIAVLSNNLSPMVVRLAWQTPYFLVFLDEAILNPAPLLLLLLMTEAALRISLSQLRLVLQYGVKSGSFTSCISCGKEYMEESLTYLVTEKADLSQARSRAGLSSRVRRVCLSDLSESECCNRHSKRSKKEGEEGG